LRSTASFGCAVDYWIQPSWNVGLMIARTPIGETNGFNRSASRYLTVQYAATSVGAVFTKTYRAFKVGGGPAIHALISSASGGRPETVPASRAQFSHWLIGFDPGIRF
jgi:hypothetical protein